VPSSDEAPEDTIPPDSPPGPSSWDGVRRSTRRVWNRALRRSDRNERSWVAVSRNLARWTLIAIPVGAVAGFGSVAFYFLWLEATQFFLVGIVGITYPYAGAPAGGVVVWGSTFPRIFLLPVVMVIGGLATGFIVERLSREVAGHGTDEAIRSFHEEGGKVRLRVPFLKMVAAALTLGTGGSGGREGPSAQIGSGFGAWWANLLNLSPKERRIALATGLGAGVGAIFRAPLGGAIYAAEVFYIQDFEPEVFFPAIVASVVSYSIFGAFYGFSTLFTLPSGGVAWNLDQIPLYALMGLICAGAGVGFVRLFRGTQSWFARKAWRPTLAIPAGMAITSGVVLACYFALPTDNHFAALAALNVGYGFVQAAMLGQLGLSTLLPLALLVLAISIVARSIATSFTVGSGGAAGLFGTSVVIGALIGVSVGSFFHGIVPGVVPVAAISGFAIVGMMTFFGGISKAPLAVLVMVSEMTASYSLLVPAMLAIFIAYIGTGPYHIYSEQVPTRLDSPAHQQEYVDYLRRLESTPQ
jgi:chloride channel protein, CIC family